MSVLRAGAGWVRQHVPRRDTIHRYRLLRPFARQLSQPNLWHLNHRSVPRAVAVGLGVGIIIPILHTFIAALIAVPTRANVAVAAACTLVVNPLTLGPLYYAAYKIGSWELRHDAMVDPGAAARVSGELSRLLFWIHQASGPIALGVLTLAAVSAALGYALTALVWRSMVHGRWRQRRLARQAARR